LNESLVQILVLVAMTQERNLWTEEGKGSIRRVIRYG